jgi:hypothetical protein
MSVGLYAQQQEILMAKSLVVVAAIMSVTSLACGGGSSNGSCGTFTPCGGSVVGTWKVATMCMSTTDAGAPKTDAACSTTTSNPNMKYGGTFTFRNDATYTADLAVSGSQTLSYSPGCFSGTYSCSAIDSVFKDPGIADAGMSVSCTSGSSGSCTCNETMNTALTAIEGVYTTSDTTITMTSGSGSSPETSDYCVQGNTLTLHESNSSGQSSTLVATK